MPGEYMTKQGKLILDCLTEHADAHLTAEEISDLLKQKASVVSIATIYRHLEKLTAKGAVRRYTSSPDEPACYQLGGDHLHCSNHFHLKCTCCNRLFHVSCEYIERLEEHIAEHHGFAVDNTRTVLYGVCKTCRENGKHTSE